MNSNSFSNLEYGEKRAVPLHFFNEQTIVALDKNMILFRSTEKMQTNKSLHKNIIKLLGTPKYE